MSQLQQTMQDGSARTLTLENQMVLEKDKCRKLQKEIIEKDKEITWLLSIPPTVEVSQDFSLILVELYASH